MCIRRWKRSVGIFLAWIFCLLGAGCGKGFDASGYTEAILNLQFQGDVKNAGAFVEGTDRSELMEMYQDFIDNFVSGYITNGMSLGENETKEFSELISTIFLTMRYEVGEAKKLEKGKYEVPVIIYPNDTFVRYSELLTEDSIRMSGKVKKGEYAGDEDEIRDQVMAEIAAQAYDLLETAYEGSEFGEKETVILRVEKDGNEIYSIDDEDMDNLIAKILRLDEIGG